MDADTFTCERCGNTHPKGRTDAEAMQEAIDNYGEAEIVDQDMAVICDDCYRVMQEQIQRVRLASEAGSRLERLANLPVEQRDAIIEKLPPESAEIANIFIRSWNSMLAEARANRLEQINSLIGSIDDTTETTDAEKT